MSARGGWWRPMLPPPLRTASQWADAERMLDSRTSSAPGRWATKPHQVEPLDRASATDGCTWIYLCWGSQMGKSDLINCMIGYWSSDAAGPMLMVQPTDKAAARYSKQRIDPMIESSPSLSAIWAGKRSRTADNTIALKEFDGGLLVLVGANTPADLSSMPIRYVVLDEIDQYTASAGGDGDPIGLAVKRTTSFARRKIVQTSTPTYEHRPIWQALIKSGWREFHVPCPHCDEPQVLEWAQMQWEPGKPETATYHCKHCGSAIDESAKRTMLPAGKWIPRHPERETGRAYGYHLSSLYAPAGWTAASWVELVREYEDAIDDPEKMRVFWNTRLALPFSEAESITVDADDLSSRAEVYARPVPAGVRILTAGVDIGIDRIECEVVGWGDDEESWSIDYAVLTGDPEQPQVWLDLEEFLSRNRDGYNVVSACIDCNYLTQTVQDWCWPRRGRRWWAIIGKAGPKRAVWAKKASRSKYALPFRSIGIDTAKDLNWARMRLAEPGPGYMHTPVGRDIEWYKQLLNERPSFHKNGERGWKKAKKSDRAEALDCRVYAYAALCSLRSAGRRLEDIAPPVDRPAVAVAVVVAAPVVASAPTARRAPKRPSKSWLDAGARWR